MTLCPFAECLGVVVPQLRSLFRCKIRFFCGMEMFLHLFYDMLGFVVVLNIQVSRCFYHFMGMPALRAELPFLKVIHVRKCPA